MFHTTLHAYNIYVYDEPGTLEAGSLRCAGLLYYKGLSAKAAKPICSEPESVNFSNYSKEPILR